MTRTSDMHPSNLLNVLDVAERAGVDTEVLLRPRGLRRVDLQRGEWISWDDYRTVVSAVSRSVGGDDALCEHAEALVEVAHAEMGAFARLPLPHLSILRFLNVTLGPRVMRCANFHATWTGHGTDRSLTLEMRLKDGYDGSLSTFRLLATAAETLSLRWPIRVSDIRVDDRGFEYTARPRRIYVEPTPEDAALRDATHAWASLTSSSGVGARQVAALRAAEAMATALSAHRSALEVAESIAEGLRTALGANGVELRLSVLAPSDLLRAVGTPTGLAHRRTFSLAAGAVGAVVVHADQRRSAQVFAALDVVGPWIEETLARFCAMSEPFEPVATVPSFGYPVLALDRAGRLWPLNAAAHRIANDRDAHEALMRQATVTLPPARELAFDAVPVRARGRLAHVLLVDRRAHAELTTRLGALEGAPTLTDRQRRALGFAARGLANAEIASALGVSEHAAESLLTRALQRVSIPTRHALVARLAGAS